MVRTADSKLGTINRHTLSEHLLPRRWGIKSNAQNACHGLRNQERIAPDSTFPHSPFMLLRGNQGFHIVPQLPGGELIAFEIGCQPASAIDYKGMQRVR